MNHHVLTLACHDQVGIVHAVTGYLAAHDCNIVDSQQFGDPDAARFFMRVHFTSEYLDNTDLRIGFEATAHRFAMEWQIHDTAVKPRAMILVSKFGHCLNDLLYRGQIGALPAEICAIVSNHRDFESLANAYDVPFHYLPVSPETKAEQEKAILELVEAEHVDFVVLARYMQVLSDELCRALSGRVINIHHSFLPSFKGARPYLQAYDRGVKVIGATAHYVTADLDEGPIIEQEIARVDHSYSPARLAAVGRDVESLALSRAVHAHAEHRVLLNGSKTVVFR
ncbi:formyltetrahydrofolate deformylase [Jatrophihabitans telluris]|uniref:Formyltetrahydrofolate deformylase n=1 Tax=Jatrophihabitans telluris TaxID=2038343 RepID=A0ABY4QUL7_9ACTN|nr:formyltetrahydrofolate deformylase [Jatrophihabitans telluris]UQX87320.1 formyltetrahydrofolate deformylase [Jatrophihabitans telluris]